MREGERGRVKKNEELELKLQLNSSCYCTAS